MIATLSLSAALTAIVPAPDALPLPAPAPLLFGLLQLTFVLHLVAMNLLLGGLLVTLFARLRGSGPHDPWTQLADRIAGTSPALVAATVTLGVAPLLFLQTLMGQFFFTSSILMGWGWFSVVVVLILAYYGTYLQSFRGADLGAARRPLLAATVLLFLWISFMFSNNTSLMLRVPHWADLYFADARGLHLNLGDPQLVPRWLHMVLGAVAVAGLGVAWWGRRLLPGGQGAFMLHQGLRFFVWPTVANIGLGFWYYLAQPSPVRKLFMGGDPAATAVFGLGFVLSVVLVVLGALALKRGAGPLGLITAAMVLELVLMVTMRDQVRGGHLTEWYRPGEFAVQTQGANIALFAVLLLGGAATVWWMVRRLAAGWHNT